MYRPDDIPLPEGWSWPLVEAQRAKWGIAANMVPVASAGGAVAWGTINSVRLALADEAARLRTSLHAAGRTKAGNDISGI